MLIADVELNTDQATQEWVQFETKAGEGLDKIIGKGGGAQKSLDGIAASTKKAAASADDLAKAFKLDKMVGALGPAKAMWDGLATSLLGVSESSSKATSKILDMAAQGAAMGQAFGPWGALAGAAAGAVVGYFGAAAEQAKEAQDKLDGIKDKAYAAVDAYRGLEKIDLSGLVKQLGDLEEAQRKAKGYSKETAEAINALAEQGYEGLQKGFELLNNQAKGVKENNDLSTYSAEGLTKAYGEQAAKLDDLSAKIEKEQAALKKQNDTYGVNAQQLDLRKTALKELTAEYEQTNNRMLAIDAAQLALNADTKALTKTTEKLTPPVVKAKESLLDYIDATDRARESVRKLNDTLLGSLEADQKAPQDADRKAYDEAQKFRALVEQDEKKRLEFSKATESAILANKEKQLGKTQALNDAMRQDAIATAGVIAGAFGQQAVAGIDLFLDAVANSEARTKEAHQRERAEFLRKTGTMLMTDGVGHVLAGTAKLFTADAARGAGEIGAGVAEFGVGLGMGGVGARLQKRLGGTAAQAGSSTSGPTVGGAQTGTQQLATINVTFKSDVPPSEREQQEIGHRLNRYLAAAKRGRP